MLVRTEDRPKTAFVTKDGLYEFNLLSFGLCNALSTFQRLMNRIFEPFLGRFILVYLDDIIIYSRTAEDHRLHVEQALATLRKEQLFTNPKKCLFFQEAIEFVGHIVTNGQVHMDPAKVTAVSERAIPQNVTELRSFLGLANYYWRFVRNYARIAAPLHDLTRSGITFTWTPAQDEAFTTLKRQLTQFPILALFRISNVSLSSPWMPPTKQ